MKKNLVALAMTLALLMSAAAYAQTIHVKATVPFSFIAGGKTLPAGTYELKSTGNGDALAIRNWKANVGTFVLSGPRQSLQPAPRSVLVFHRYGQRYFLAEIWVQGDKLGHQVPSSSREVEVAKDFSMDQVVLMATKN